ncbi:MAG: hypothetical protein AAF074_08675 [Pseudomonadota bacterium]
MGLEPAGLGRDEVLLERRDARDALDAVGGDRAVRSVRLDAVIVALAEEAVGDALEGRGRAGEVAEDMGGARRGPGPLVVRALPGGALLGVAGDAGIATDMARRRILRTGRAGPAGGGEEDERAGRGAAQGGRRRLARGCARVERGEAMGPARGAAGAKLGPLARDGVAERAPMCRVAPARRARLAVAVAADGGEGLRDRCGERLERRLDAGPPAVERAQRAAEVAGVEAAAEGAPGGMLGVPVGGRDSRDNPRRMAPEPPAQQRGEEGEAEREPCAQPRDRVLRRFRGAGRRALDDEVDARNLRRFQRARGGVEPVDPDRRQGERTVPAGT